MRDVACLIILQAIGKVPFAGVVWYQEDPRRTRKLLHERYSVKSTFSKAIVHSTLAEKKYTSQPRPKYVMKWESCPAYTAWMDAQMDDGVLVTMITEGIDDRLKLLSGMALLALLTEEDFTLPVLT